MFKFKFKDESIERTPEEIAWLEEVNKKLHEQADEAVRNWISRGMVSWTVDSLGRIVE